MYLYKEKIVLIFISSGLLWIFFQPVVSECQIPGPQSRTECDGSVGGITEQDCYNLPDNCCWDTSVPGVAWCYKDTSTTAVDEITIDLEITTFGQPDVSTTLRSQAGTDDSLSTVTNANDIIGKTATALGDVTNGGPTTSIEDPGATSKLPTEPPNIGTSAKAEDNPSTEGKDPSITSESGNLPVTSDGDVSTTVPEVNPSTEGDSLVTTPSDSHETTQDPGELSTEGDSNPSTVGEVETTHANNIVSTVQSEVTTDDGKTTVPQYETTTTEKLDTTVSEDNPTTKEDTTITTTTTTTTKPAIETTTDVSSDNTTDTQGGGGGSSNDIEWWGYLLIGVGSAIALLVIVLLIVFIAKRSAANDLFAHELLTYDPPKQTVNGNSAVAFDVSGNKDALDLDDIIAEPARNQPGSFYTEKSGFEYKGQNSFSNPSYDEGAAAF